MRKSIFCLLISCFFLSGCVVGSIEPFYTSDLVVEKQDLFGRWDFDDSANPVPNSQIIISSGKVTIFDDDGNPLDAKLTFFRVEDSLFADIYADEGKLKEDLVGESPPPVHLVALVKVEEDKVKFNDLNYDWLSKEVVLGRINIRYTRASPTTDILFTPTSQEWVEFLKKYRNSSKAFPSETESFMIRKPEFMRSAP